MTDSLTSEVSHSAESVCERKRWNVGTKCLSIALWEVASTFPRKGFPVNSSNLIAPKSGKAVTRVTFVGTLYAPLVFEFESWL